MTRGTKAREYTKYVLFLTISCVEVVDVGIAEGTAGHGITTDTNARDDTSSVESRQNDKSGGHQPRHRSNHIKNLKEHRLGDGGIELADIKGSRRGRARCSGRVVRGNRRRSGGRRRNRNGRLGSGLGGDLRNSGGRHLAGVFRLVFFLFDKVVTAGKLFYDWARGRRNESGRKKHDGEDDTHTEGNTVTAGLGFYIYMI